MKRTIVTFLVLAATTTTLAVAQDGIGHGPPSSPVIVVPQLPLPSPGLPTGSAPKVLQPSLR
jgi:hypothetical protein